MRQKERETRHRPFRVKKVYGEPVVVGERQLTPVVRVFSFGKARATIGLRGVSGWGMGWERIVPIALVEKTAGGESAIPITNTTAVALRTMLVAAVLITLFFSSIRCLVERRR
jgi:hypothetical protein